MQNNGIISFHMVKLLDFKASWCAPCRIMAPAIAELKKELEGKVEVVEIDVDEKANEAAEYGVMSIPTFVVIKNGKEAGRKIGMTSKEDLRKLLQV